MTDLFKKLTNQHRVFLEESKDLEKEEVLKQAQALLKEIREAGTFIVEPEERTILSTLARHLGEIIFDISEWYPSVRLASAVFPDQSDESSGLSPDLLRQCRSSLLNSSEFDSDASLQALLTSPELASFRFGIPAATSKQDRIDKTIAYLLQKRLSNGQPALPSLLAALRDRQPVDNESHKQLEALHDAVAEALGVSAQKTNQLTVAADKLDRAAGDGISAKQSAEMAPLGQLLELTRHLPDIQKQIVSFLDSPNLPLGQEKVERITQTQLFGVNFLLPENWAKAETEIPTELPKETFHLPFAGREAEKQLIREGLEADFYVQIHAPSGLGKTYLMKEVQSQFREEGWQTIWIDFGGPHRDCIANRYRFLQAFSEQLDDASRVGSFSETSSLEQIGLALADNLNPVVLFIDDADQAAPQLLSWIRETFLHTLMSDWQVPIRVLAAGQQIIPEWVGVKRGGLFQSFPLSHFDDPLVIEQIINHVVARFGARRVQEKVAKNNEAWKIVLETMVDGLLSISCGHPLVMAEVLRYTAERNGFMQATFFTKNRAELCDRCLAPIVDGRILPTVEHSVREAFRSLCIFRYVWPTLISQLTSSDISEELGGAWEPFSEGRRGWRTWWSRVEDTHLIEPANTHPLYRISPVIRQLIALVLHAEDDALYRARNRRARQICERLLADKKIEPIQRAAYMLELFYHATQDHSLSPADLSATFTQTLTDFLNRLATDQSAPQVALQLQAWLREDTELQEAINQSAGPGLYNQLTETVNHALVGFGAK